MNDMPSTPTLDRMLSLRDESQPIDDFLANSQYQLAVWVAEGECPSMDCPSWGSREDHLHPVEKSIEQILADYFDIDLAEAERERQAILDHLREG